MNSQTQPSAPVAHTPGPWHVETFRQHGENFDSILVRAHGENADAFNEDNMTVAVMTHMRNGDANARLIAAAPELLGTLKQLVFAITEDAATPMSEDSPALIWARAAIAKAEGRAS